MKKRKPVRRNSNRPIDKKYEDWRRKVFARDKGRCRFPKCTNTRGIQAHHIERWADNPSLRFQVSNGITLCWKCHKRVTGTETIYARLFKTIVNGHSRYDVMKKLRDASEEEREE